MRASTSVILAILTACSVPAKQPIGGDGGPDGGTDGPGDGSPDTTITAAPEAFSSLAASTFEFTSNDPTATFQCSVDGESAVPCNSPYTRTLNDGSHGFSVRAVSTSGKSDDTPAEHLWTIDTQAPETTITTGPPSADNSTMVRFEFTSNEMEVVFECSLDNAAYQACTSGSSFGPITDGAHSFAVRARDRAGNGDGSPAIRAWTVDTRTPDTQIVSGPSGSSGSTSATFAFSSPDAGAGATFECSLDGGGFAACTSPRVVSGLAEGAHTFAVRVRDGVGNVDPTPATRTWSVDLTAPNTTITGGPTGTVAMASATFTFASSEPGSTFQCALDISAFAACTSPAMLTGLAQGMHTFTVRAVDGAGQADATPAARSWTVDTAGPDIAVTAGPTNGSTSGPRVTFAFTVSDGSPTCSVDSNTFRTCASPFAFNVGAGDHQFRVRATDAAGNTTTEVRAWTVACSAPDATGAAGLLHLNDTDQMLANAVVGAAPATLGDDATVEAADPAPLTAGRFGGALAFTDTDSDHVSWPAALGPTPAFAVELWTRPAVVQGTRELFRSGDGRVMIRVSLGGTGVRYSAIVMQSVGGTRTVTSATVPPGVWHHVLMSLSEPMLRMWVDAGRGEVGNVAMGTPAVFDTMRLGGSAAIAYGGDLDEVWVSQAAIADDESALSRYCPP